MPRTHTGSRRASRPRSNRFRPTPQRSTRVVRKTPIEGPDGGTQVETTTVTRNRRQRSVERRTPIPTGGSQYETTTDILDTPDRQRRQYRVPSPVKAGQSAGGVGALEAEFVAAELIIFIGIFADSTTGYADKMLSIMKRALLTGILFFFLALLSSAGPGATKAAKAFGGLIVVSMLLTSPSLANFLSNLAKSDFSSVPVTVDTSGIPSSANDQGSPANTFSQLPANIQKQLEGEPVFTQFSGILGGASEAYNFLKNFGNGLLGKLGL